MKIYFSFELKNFLSHSFIAYMTDQSTKMEDLTNPKNESTLKDNSAQMTRLMQPQARTVVRATTSERLAHQFPWENRFVKFTSLSIVLVVKMPRHWGRSYVKNNCQTSIFNLIMVWFETLHFPDGFIGDHRYTGDESSRGERLCLLSDLFGWCIH